MMSSFARWMVRHSLVEIGANLLLTAALGYYAVHIRGVGDKRGSTLSLPFDMVVGAFNEAFDVAVLISGDAEFIPAVQEVKRRGHLVVLGAVVDNALSDPLRRAVDRFVPIRLHSSSNMYRPLESESRPWPRD
jgi:NYN domain-containing protein